MNVKRVISTFQDVYTELPRRGLRRRQVVDVGLHLALEEHFEALGAAGRSRSERAERIALLS